MSGVLEHYIVNYVKYYAFSTTFPCSIFGYFKYLRMFCGKNCQNSVLHGGLPPKIKS